jgi:hypothetical protein
MRKAIHMPTGDNKVTINLTTEVKIFVDKRKGDLERSFYLALEYLKQHKDEFIAEYGQQSYEDHVKRYSRTAVELKNAHYAKKKETLEAKRRELELREKELAVKSSFLNAETQAMTDKHDKRQKELDEANKTVEQERLEHLDQMIQELENKIKMNPTDYSNNKFYAERVKGLKQDRELLIRQIAS